MRRTILLVALCAFVATPAFADIPFTWTNGGSTISLTSVAQVKLDSGLVWDDAFAVTLMEGQLKGSIYPQVVVPPQNPVFVYRTFCVESSIYFYPGTTYYVSIDPKAYSGGQPGTAGESIHAVSEYIYDRYLATKPTDAATLDAMRLAIWYAEGELGGIKNAIYDDALLKVGGVNGNATHTWALNLWTLEQVGTTWVATDVQSQLVTVPVPVPATILLGFLGFGAVGLKLRKLV